MFIPALKIKSLTQKLLSLLLITYCSTSLADSYYCSSQGGNGYVNSGDTMAQVQATCGPPASVSQQQTPSSTQQQIQDWAYSGGLTVTVAGSNNQAVAVGQIKSAATQTIRVLFHIVNNQITAIQTATQGNTSKFTCPFTGDTVSVGMSAKQLSQACGQPSMIHTSTQTTPVQPETIVYWSYQMTSYAPPVIMAFKNGLLVQVKQQ